MFEKLNRSVVVFNFMWTLNGRNEQIVSVTQSNTIITRKIAVSFTEDDKPEKMIKLQSINCSSVLSLLDDYILNKVL